MPEVSVDLRLDEGHVVHAKLDRLKHGMGVTLGTFLATFSDWSDVTPFEVKYAISVTERPDRIEGILPMIVTVVGPAESS
jgi:hypothetical protein